MSNHIAEEARKIISQYPIITRGTTNSQNYIQYKYDWDVFNRVWIYNYTIETLNKNASVVPGSRLLNSYEFQSQDERTSFVRGKYAHSYVYPASTSLFVFEPPINLSSFYNLSTTYGINLNATLSTNQGLSTVVVNSQIFQANISTLHGFSTTRQIRPLTVGEVARISSIISPMDVNTFISLDGSFYMSTLLSQGVNDPVILPIGVSTLAIYVSSDVLNISPGQFYNYVASNTVNNYDISTLTTISTFEYFNRVYTLYPPELSTLSSLSTLLASNVKYSNFPLTSINTLHELSNTLLYPPSRLSTYTSLSSLASYSTIFQYTSTNLSSLASLSTIAFLSSVFTSSINASNDSTLFYISTRLSLYTLLSSCVNPGYSQLSTFYTLSTYSAAIN